MGFGSVIATAISIIVLLAAGYMLVGSITHSADATGASIKAAADVESRRMNTELAIDNLGCNSGEGWFSFHLNNVGSEKIVDITQMDVIVKMISPDQSVYYVPYGTQDAHAATYWDYENLTSIMVGIGDAVNPGMLDPGEFVNIRVHAEECSRAGTAWVQVTTPEGASASTNVVIV
jgi:hypothetical protein